MASDLSEIEWKLRYLECKLRDGEENGCDPTILDKLEKQIMDLEEQLESNEKVAKDAHKVEEYTKNCDDRKQAFFFGYGYRQ